MFRETKTTSSGKDEDGRGQIMVIHDLVSGDMMMMHEHEHVSPRGGWGQVYFGEKIKKRVRPSLPHDIPLPLLSSYFKPLSLSSDVNNIIMMRMNDAVTLSPLTGTDDDPTCRTEYNSRRKSEHRTTTLWAVFERGSSSWLCVLFILVPHHHHHLSPNDE